MSTVITNDETRERIAVHLPRIMAERKMTQATLSRVTGESEMTISQVVRGLHVPNSAILHRIAEALQVKMDDLVAPIAPKVAKPMRKRRQSA